MVYIFLADGFEEIEALTVVDLLRRASISIAMVSITGDREVTGAHQIKVASDLLFEEADYSDARMLVLPGGLPGTDNLLAHKGLDGLLKEFSQMGRTLAAICAAPMVLAAAGVLEGKKATIFTGMENKLAGAKYKKDTVVVDGKIITSKGPGTAMEFALTLVEIIRGRAIASTLKKDLIY